MGDAQTTEPVTSKSASSQSRWFKKLPRFRAVAFGILAFIVILVAVYTFVPIQPTNRIAIQNEVYGKFNFSPDGASLAVTTYKSHDDVIGAIRIWDVQQAVERCSPVAARGDPEFSPNGRYFAARSETGNFKLWFTQTGAEVANIPIEQFFHGRPNPIRSGFSPDSKLFVFQVSSWTTFWNIEQAKEVVTVYHDFNTHYFSPDGTSAITVSSNSLEGSKEVTIWQISADAAPLPLSKFTIPCSELAVSHDRKTIAALEGPSSKAQAICLWSVASASRFAQIDISKEKRSWSGLSFKGEGILLSYEAFRGNLAPPGRKIWALSAMPRHVGEFEGREWTFSTSSSGSLLAVPLVDGVKLIETATGRETLRLVHLGDSAFREVSPLFSPDDKLLAVRLEIAPHRPFFADWPLFNRIPIKSKSTPGFRLWDVETGRELFAFEDISQFQFSPDNKYIATDGPDNTINLWRLPLRKPIWLILQWTAVIWLGVVVGLWMLGKLWRLVLLLRNRRAASLQPRTFPSPSASLAIALPVQDAVS